MCVEAQHVTVQVTGQVCTCAGRTSQQDAGQASKRAPAHLVQHPPTLFSHHPPCSAPTHLVQLQRRRHCPGRAYEADPQLRRQL
eukprot:364328-Chlamydomonas_euryale.AAC.6